MPKRRPKAALLAAFLTLASQKAFGGAGGNSAGLVFSLYQPTYGEFETLALAAGQPKFPTRMLMVGLQAEFSRRGLLTYGRAMVGSTETEKTGTTPSATQLSNHNIGMGMGWSIDMGAAELALGLLAGHGHQSVSMGSSTSGGILQMDYLFLEPQLSFGLDLMPSLRVTAGGGYHYGMVYQVRQHATEILSDPSKATAKGINILLGIQFGQF